MLSFSEVGERLADEHACISMNQPHIVQFDSAAHVARETFDLDEGSLFDPILLAAGFDYCVHEGSSR